MAADTVEQIKQKLTIVDVVSPYVKLTRAGKYFKGLSPFNKEKTPSFMVSPDRGSYYCFSSGQGGDMFTFIEKMEGVDFKGAMKILAEKAGVEIVFSKGGSANKEKTERLREALGEAEQFYARAFVEGGVAHEYAKKRGLTSQTMQEWRIGYAPDAWRALFEELSAKGFTTQELVDAGLIKEADEKRGTYYDRFRNRLMFPIRDSAGRTVAFTGRALDPNDQAKYLNSPETELYKKGQILFGMDRAKDAIRTRGFALLVEGQFDLILLHQIGFTNTIALSGTALTHEHISLIKRYAENLMLALDADRAGLAASAKHAIAALRSGMRVKAVRMPQGKDPADLANEDPKGITKLIADAQSIVEFFLAVLTGAEKDPHKLVVAVEKVVLPLIQAIQSPLEREHFIGVAARAIGSTADAVRGSLAKAPRLEDAPRQTGVTNAPLPVAQLSPLEARRKYLHAVAVNCAGSEVAKTLEEEYKRITGTSLPEELPSERMLFEAGLAFVEMPTQLEVEDLIKSFEQAFLKEEIARASARVRQAEIAGDTKDMQSAMQELKALSTKLSVLS